MAFQKDRMANKIEGKQRSYIAAPWENFNLRKLTHIAASAAEPARSGAAGLRPEVTFCRSRVFRQHCLRPDRTADQFAFAIWADAAKDAVRTARAERAFKRAYSCIGTSWLKIAVAAFAIRFELQHGIPPDPNIAHGL
jgi:hypothetical protein